MHYTLGSAARATGLAKSTIHRAIKAGRISARAKDGNSYEIDPAELHRVFPPLPIADAQPAPEPVVERSATPGDPDLERRLAVALFEVSNLKALLDVSERRADELRTERDRWHAAHTSAEQRLLTDQTERRRRWFWR